MLVILVSKFHVMFFTAQVMYNAFNTSGPDGTNYYIVFYVTNRFHVCQYVKHIVCITSIHITIFIKVSNNASWIYQLDGKKKE